MRCCAPFYYFFVILNVVLKRCLETFYYVYFSSKVCVCIRMCLCVVKDGSRGEISRAKDHVTRASAFRIVERHKARY